MNKTTQVITTIIIVAAIVIIAVVVAGKKNSTKVAALNYDEFAQCLTDTGATYYGAFWCPNCQRQNELFGKSKKFVNYIECSTPDKRQKEECQDAGIEGYPTWEFADGSRVTGTQSLESLAEKTSCELPKREEPEAKTEEVIGEEA